MKTITIVRFACVVAVIGIGGATVAEEVSAEDARLAAHVWTRRSSALGGDATNVTTLADQSSGARLHVVRMSKGGFVVMASDDELEPVVAFSKSGDGIAQDGGPVWELLRRVGGVRRRSANVSTAAGSSATGSVMQASSAIAAAAKAKWRLLLGNAQSATNAASPLRLANVSNSGASKMFNVHVSPLLTTRWGQGGVGDLLCYNMFTPTQTVSTAASIATDRSVAGNGDESDGVHAPCGCVATAGAQLMKYFKHPSSCVAKQQFSCKAFGTSVTLETRGEKYRWSDMPDRPSTSTPESMRAAIGTLTYDVGVACKASYGLSSTSASSYNLANALLDVFGYSQVVYFDFYNSRSLSRTDENFMRAVLPNLIDGRPVLLSMQGAGSGGHEIVIDGYAYDHSYGTTDEECYVHMNFGWTGSCDLWFRPPMTSDPIIASSYRYTYFDSIIGNVFASGSGSLVAGRVRRNGYGCFDVKVCLNGKTSGGVSVSKETQTDSCGQYSFVVAPGAYTLFAYNAAGPWQSGSYQVDVGECTGSAIGNALLDIPLDENAVAATPEVDDDELLNDVIAVSCSTEGATIRYTDDGTDPTILSTLYVSPIHVWRTGEYRFAAFVPGMARSEVRSVTMTIAKWKTDSFDSAGAVTGESGTLELSNENATREEGEPNHGDYSGGASVWVSFTPEADGDYTFHATGTSISDGDSTYTMIALYTGDSVDALTRVDSASGYSDNFVSLHAKAGVTYRIALDTYRGEKSNLTLSWESGFTDKLVISNCGAFASVNGNAMNLGITTTAAWSVTDVPSWITLEKSGGEAGETLFYRVERNTSGKIRTGQIIIAAGNADPVSVTVTQGTQTWMTNRIEALTVARSEKKPILLVEGRETCGNTKGTMFTSCETSPVRERLREGYVLWFCNGDTQYSECSRYFVGTDYDYYPCVCVIDPDTPETSLARDGGYQTAAEMTALLDKAARTPAVSVSEGQSVSSVELSWKRVAGATQYVVYRGGTSGSMSVLKSGLAATAYADSSAAEGTQYYYAVAAVVDGVTREMSVPQLGYRKLTTPCISSITGTTYWAEISWSAVAGAKCYAVYRRYEDETKASVLSQCRFSTSFVDGDYRAGKTAYYTVVAAYDYEWVCVDSDWTCELLGTSDVSSPMSYQKGASVYRDLNDGGECSPSPYEFGDKVYLWTPSRDGYRFDGWYTAKTGGEKIVFPYTITARTVNMYAHWTPYAYKVELIAPEVIFERTQLALVATVTNLASGLLVVTNDTVWKITSGNSAMFETGGVLSPVATTGSVTIEASAEFWGVDYMRTAMIDVIRAEDIQSLAIEGPKVVDLYDVVGAQYLAKMTASNGKTYVVQPSWSVAESAVTNAVIGSNGYVSFSRPSRYDKASVMTVFAQYNGKRASISAPVWGWRAELTAWTCDCRVLYPGYSGRIVPGAIRWWRHGIQENSTTDLSGIRLVVDYGWINNSKTFVSSGDDATFSIPLDADESDGYAYPYACVESERLGRTVSFSTACWMSYASTKPSAWVSVKFNAEGGFPATQTTRYDATSRTWCWLPTVVRNGYLFTGWYTERAGGRRVYSSEIGTAGVTELYARWEPAASTVRFAANGGTGAMEEIRVTNFSVRKLPPCSFMAPKGKRFAGWACSNGRCYDDGVLVFNLAEPGETVTMTAIWE